MYDLILMINFNFTTLSLIKLTQINRHYGIKKSWIYKKFQKKPYLRK